MPFWMAVTLCGGTKNQMYKDKHVHVLEQAKPMMVGHISCLKGKNLHVCTGFIQDIIVHCLVKPGTDMYMYTNMQTV